MRHVISSLWNLLLKAGWAPVAVVVFHAIVAKTSLRSPLDFTIHFLGGASIAFFLFHALEGFRNLFGNPTALGHYLFSFALACTVGLFWEFGELFSDTFLHTHIQRSIGETMSDLIADATGATTSLFVVAIVICIRKRCSSP
jgi:hypothetical protein